MAAIDLIVLGMLKQGPMSAYDVQKLVEYRNISKWVKISTPSIYKKVLQLEEKGLLSSAPAREGRLPEKTVYSLTEAGEAEFQRLMLAVSAQPIRMFLDCNAVLVNLEGLSPEGQKICTENIRANIAELKAALTDNLGRKEHTPEVPALGLAVLRQQLALAEALEAWIGTLGQENG